MSRQELNLGILAHVDAGKTTLTERLLYNAGVIAAVGSVDAGTTQTDSLPLEQRRGITIKSAVASFSVDDVHVNLIDTPGHPDFIAEVERVLSVLDGAVLVISAVEGVQPQTRILMRALQRLRVPTVMFVNKLDRAGADPERVVAEVREKLVPDPIVYVGSARTGTGVEELAAGIVRHLSPTTTGDPSAPLSAQVFKIERGPRGEKVAYARLFAGTVGTRDRVPLGGGREGKVTSLAVFENGGAVRRQRAAAGSVAKLWGLSQVAIGDWLGKPRGDDADRQFAPPTLEAVVVPQDADHGPGLRVALTQLAEQDPLIDVRQEGGRMSVSLYGEVQKEVIEATLLEDFGIAVEFRETTPIFVERLIRTSRAFLAIHEDGNPYDATLGFRVEPSAPEAGITYRSAIAGASAPIHIYKTRRAFDEHMTQYVEDSLASGVYGWRVTDCIVTLTDCEHAVADGPPSKRGSTSASDFKELTPIVLHRAIEGAGTVVCEPMLRAHVELPVEAVGALTAVVARLAGTVDSTTLEGVSAELSAVLPAARIHELQRRLPGLTHGEGVLDTEFAGYRPVTGDPPRRNSRP